MDVEKRSISRFGPQMQCARSRTFLLLFWNDNPPFMSSGVVEVCLNQAVNFPLFSFPHIARGEEFGHCRYAYSTEIFTLKGLKQKGNQVTYSLVLQRLGRAVPCLNALPTDVLLVLFLWQDCTRTYKHPLQNSHSTYCYLLYCCVSKAVLEAATWSSLHTFSKHLIWASEEPRKDLPQTSYRD